MASTIDVARIVMFSDNYKHLAQEMGSVYRPLFEDVEVVGKRRKENFIASTSASTKTGRNQGITYVDPTHTARWLATKTKYWSTLVDKEDILRVMADPRSKYLENGVIAMNNEFDSVVETAFDATVTTGEDADGSTTFPTATQQVAVGSTGLTTAKLRSALQILEQNGFVHQRPQIPLYCVYTPAQKNNLLATTEIGSADYNIVKALVNGEIDTWMNFKFLTSTLNGSGDGLGAGLSTNRDVWCFSGDSMQVGHGRDLHVKVTEQTDLVGHPWQIYIEEDYGAMRLEETKVVQVVCNETV